MDCKTICRVFVELLDALAKKQLSGKQLRYLSKVRENHGLLYYQLVNKLSAEQRVPKSTVKWNLNKLRDAGMIVAGNKEAKGVPVKLTEKGEITLLILEGKYEFLGNNCCPKTLFETKQHLQSHGAANDEAKDNLKE